MGILGSLRNLLGQGTQYENVTYVGPSVSDVLDMSVEELYRTQPHLRTVVSFIARNIAQLPLTTYRRVSDVDRRRAHDDPVTELIRRPNSSMTTYDLVYDLVASLKLYDKALWSVAKSNQVPAGWEIRPIPASWIQSMSGGSLWAPEKIRITAPNGRAFQLSNSGEIPEFILFHGWSPGQPKEGSSPVFALKQVLAEQIQAWSFREQIWQRGGRVGSYITRPAGAPAWSDDARTKFARDWQAKWTGKDGPKAGGTPLFEEGMELKTVRFNAREEEWSEVAKLALSTVASVYHVNPTMVGVNDNANYSNVREFHKMLYQDSLGPDLARIEQTLNSFLVPLVSADPHVYVEFNLQAKLAGTFEEQAQVLSTSTGGPWMTRNEARARLNMPQIDCGDELITPLNVITGGQASPHDSGSQNLRESDSARLVKAAARRVKAEPDDEAVEEAQSVLRKFFRRQRDAVLARLGSKDSGWWDEERWDDELAADMYALALDVTARVGGETAVALGMPESAYDVDRTLKFLDAVAATRARMINDATLRQIKAALAEDLSEDAEKSTPAGVFEEAVTTRAELSGVTLATTFTTFAVAEMGQQLPRSGVMKTWVTTSADPRPSHAIMDGETVPIDNTFSNGMEWPGDVSGAGGDAGEIANCSCVVEILIP